VYVAITTKPVRPLQWGELQVQRRHKAMDAVGIGIMVILAVSVVVLLLQMKRQNAELAALRSAMPDSGSNAVDENVDQAGDEIVSMDQTITTPALESTAKRVG
jgi:hypothetical protein